MKNIEALIEDGGGITLGAIGVIKCAATAADDHNALAMLVRSRPSVRLGRAVSWLDVGVIGAWQALTVFVALIVQPVWGLSVLAAVIAFVAAVVVSVRELWAEARGAVREQVRMTRAYADPALFPDRQQRDSEVIVLHEVREGR